MTQKQARLALPLAQRTSVWRNCFKTFRQFGETLIKMLIADIKRHSMSDIRAVVFHNSYVTGNEKLQITKMTMRLPAAIAPQPLFRAA